MFDRIGKPTEEISAKAPATVMRAPAEGEVNPQPWERGMAAQPDYTLKLSPEIEAMLLAMCARGELDPLRCAEMRLRRERQGPLWGSSSPAPLGSISVPDVRLPDLRDPALLRHLLAQFYAPVRAWLRKNTPRLRNYALAGLVCTAKLEVPEARKLGDGEIELLAREWAAENGHTIPPGFARAGAVRDLPGSSAGGECGAARHQLGQGAQA